VLSHIYSFFTFVNSSFLSVALLFVRSSFSAFLYLLDEAFVPMLILRFAAQSRGNSIDDRCRIDAYE
jgi:hypothetical protein